MERSISGADAPCVRNFAAVARSVRNVASQGHERPSARSDGVETQHLPLHPPACPVGIVADAREDEPQIYARWYLDRIAAIRRYMPDCAITTDLIAGFCSETDEDHRQTLSLMREVGYEFAYMFKYSERPDTFAQRHMPDDVPDSVKTARLNEIIALQNTLSAESNARDVGKEFEILVEGTSKRSDRQLFGRTSQNKVVVFDRGECRIGDYVRVRVTASSSATLQGELVERTRPFEV